MKFTIPGAALAQHIAVLGKNGSGKTYTTKAVIVEPALAAGKRVAIVDPTSAWWGLRTSADGKGPGFKILVLGGDHGDLPLPALGGAAVARLIVEQGVNLVADTGLMTVADRTRWMIDFAGTLYRLNRSPLHLVIDEAHVFAPQGKVPDPDTGKMLHAVNQIAAGGRSRGIRLTMLTQRPQKLHKDTLTTADTLIAMRVLAPQDRDAVKAWIDGCGDPAQGREVLGSLASLKRGEGWLWYPEGGVLRRQQFPAITTFDSSATPKEGDSPVTPRGSASMDLSEIKAALASAVAEAEANDPKKLKERIAELEALAGKANACTHTAADIVEARRTGERSGYERATELMREHMAGVLLSIQQTASTISGTMDALERAVEKIDAEIAAAAPVTMTVCPPGPRSPETQHALEQMGSAVARSLQSEPAAGGGHARGMRSPVDHSRVAAASPAKPGAVGSSLPRGEAQILTALIQFPKGLRREQITVLTTFARSTRDRYLQYLQAKGLVEAAGDVMVATPAGRDAVPNAKPLPTGRALREHWYGILPEGERRILEVLVAAYPKSVQRDQITSTTGYARSTRDRYLQYMQNKMVVTTDRGAARAAAELFE